MSLGFCIVACVLLQSPELVGVDVFDGALPDLEGIAALEATVGVVEPVVKATVHVGKLKTPVGAAGRNPEPVGTVASRVPTAGALGQRGPRAAQGVEVGPSSSGLETKPVVPRSLGIDDNVEHVGLGVVGPAREVPLLVALAVTRAAEGQCLQHSHIRSNSHRNLATDSDLVGMDTEVVAALGVNDTGGGGGDRVTANMVKLLVGYGWGERARRRCDDEKEIYMSAVPLIAVL